MLSAILSDPGALDRVSDKLSPESFYHSAHSKIYAVATELAARSKPVDLIQTADLLQAKNQLKAIGGKTFLVNLMADPIASINADLHAAVIAEKHLRRELISSARRIAELAYDQTLPIQDVLEQAEDEVYRIANQQEIDGVQAEHISEACIRVYEANENGKPPGVLTGFLDLDKITGGLFPGQLVTVAAATAMGKTHFGIAQALNVAMQGHPVLIFSCEMTADELVARFNARLSGISSSVINRCEVDGPKQFEAFLGSTHKLLGLPIYIVGSSNPSPAAIRGQIRRVTVDAGATPRLVVLDYLQLLGEGHDNRVREIDLITRACKGVAMDFKLTFMALAQINRGVELRKNKRPCLADLRESGSIEQHSNQVIFLYRDEYYDPETFDKGIVELIVAKNRGGQTGTARMLFAPEHSHFMDIAQGRDR